MEELQYVRIAVCMSWGEWRLEQLQFGGVAMWRTCNLGDLRGNLRRIAGVFFHYVDFSTVSFPNILVCSF